MTEGEVAGPWDDSAQGGKCSTLARPRLVRSLIPIFMFLGRTHRVGCEPPVRGPCDPTFLRPVWTPYVMLAGLLLGIGLLLDRPLRCGPT